MNTYPFGNDPAKVEGYRRFWNRESVKRPLVGFSYKSWFPLEEFTASNSWPQDCELTPEMIDPQAFLDDQEKLLIEGETMDDDILRGASPSQAVFWCCGTLGSQMRVKPGNVVALDRSLEWDELRDVSFASHKNSPWFRKYADFIDALVKRSAGRFPVSHGTLVGPLDYAVSLRGHEQTAVDLMLEAEKSSELLQRLAQFFIDITKAAWARIPQYLGGYYDAQYQLWAPGTIARLQEDAVAVISPDLYKRLIQPIDRMVAQQFESCFIHLHATSMFVLDLMLEVEEIRCYEINNDVGGPPVDTMVPYFQKVQRANRPLLIRGSFTTEELQLLLDSLEPAGLYLYIMVRDQREIDTLRPLLKM